MTLKFQQVRITHLRFYMRKQTLQKNRSPGDISNNIRFKSKDLTRLVLSFWKIWTCYNEPLRSTYIYRVQTLDKMEPTLKMSIQRGNYGSSRMTWPRFYATCSFTNIKENILEFDFQHVDEIGVLPTIKCRDFTSQENLSRPEFSKDGGVFHVWSNETSWYLCISSAMVPNDSHTICLSRVVYGIHKTVTRWAKLYSCSSPVPILVYCTSIPVHWAIHQECSTRPTRVTDVTRLSESPVLHVLYDNSSHFTEKIDRAVVVKISRQCNVVRCRIVVRVHCDESRYTALIENTCFTKTLALYRLRVSSETRQVCFYHCEKFSENSRIIFVVLTRCWRRFEIKIQSVKTQASRLLHTRLDEFIPSFRHVVSISPNIVLSVEISEKRYDETLHLYGMIQDIPLVPPRPPLSCLQGLPESTKESIRRRRDR